MKHFILLFIFVSLNCFSQNNEVYKIDEYVSLQIPKGYTIKDTLGSKSATVAIDGGSVVVSKMTQELIDADVYDEDQLTEYYKGFQKGFIKGAKGQKQSEKIIQINNLKASRLIFKMPLNGELVLIETTTIYLKDHVYSFSFFNLSKTNPNFEVEKQKILASIKFAKDLSIEDQFNSHDEGSTAYKLGELFGSLLAIGIIAFLVYYVSKKRKTF